MAGLRIIPGGTGDETAANPGDDWEPSLCGLDRGFELRCGSQLDQYFSSNLYEYYQWSDQLQVLMGLSLLLNAAVIGTLWLLARKFRCCRRTETSSDRPTPPAFTFLCAHFVALGLLTGLLMPEVFNNYRQSLLSVAWFLEATWSGHRGEPLDGRIVEILKISLLILGFSGPPLLVSWLAGVAAKRASGRIPRLRFVGMTLLVSFGFAVTALAVAIAPRPFSEWREGVALDFQVVDRDSGEPIRGSFLLIRNAFEENPCVRDFSGPDGRVRLKPGLYATGEGKRFSSDRDGQALGSMARSLRARLSDPTNLVDRSPRLGGRPRASPSRTGRTGSGRGR